MTLHLQTWLSIGCSLAILTSVNVTAARADGPKDNLPDQVRRIPALGVEVPAADRAELEGGLAKLKASIERLEQKGDAKTRALLPDVKIYFQAVHDALKYQEFFVAAEIGKGKSLLKTGQTRADQLAAGEAPWTTQTGLVVRGYVSKIDGSVQPYGLVIPESYQANGKQKHRLDLWFHGRGENLSEVNFIDQREKQKGQFTPADTIVLHPYGRYCNANKFAGEIDTLEAIESVEKRYRIDTDRIVARGFSMGGAACWQFAVHYSDRWVAANPGAGFAETAEFLNVFQDEKVAPTWYEKKLGHWYDCTDWALNLFHCKTVAYSGEIDKQKQAADIMERAMQREGLKLTHIIGPKTAHKYEPEAAATVERLVSEIASHGLQHTPPVIHFVTYTLRYNRMHWVTVNGLGEHWKRAEVDGELVDRQHVRLKTDNVTSLTLSMPTGTCPLPVNKPVLLRIDGQELTGTAPTADESWQCDLHKLDGKWTVGFPLVHPFMKHHGMQGPIDDAFMDSFLIVRPTGKCSHPKVEKWVHAEMDRAIEHWRRQFRGHPRVKDDKDVTLEDMESSNLVLWGDPAANLLLAKLGSKLPIRWTDEQIEAGDQKFPAADHALIEIHPNPANPKRYVVLNSGFTYRDYDYLNNARQVPKLPDWAVVDLNTSPDSRFPGKVVAADFFGEKWELKGESER